MTINTAIVISSYDIFDTLLTRRVCDPKAVFFFAGREAAKRGLTSITPEAFRKARMEAESLSRIGIPDGEVDFDGIYRVLGRIVGCTEGKLRELMGIELDWERRLIVPIPDAKEMVNVQRRAGCQIHFISEMYLPAEFLESLLREHGFMEEGDKLWVSNGRQASKRSGKLFSIFLKESGANPSQIQHYGNDSKSDVLTPQRLGIRAIHRPQANPTYYETLLERYSHQTNGWTSLMAGAGRLVRLQPHADARIAGLRRITANVVCPSITCYVLWILQRAKFLGLRRLYFISRDGYVPYLLAKQIAAKLLPDLECRYFYGSRRAWHLAGLDIVDAGALNWILGHGDGMTCASMLNRLELTWDECRKCGPELAATMGDPENTVTEKVRQAVKTALQTDSDFFKAVMAKSKEKRALLTGYATQEGLLDEQPVGMVDIGWFGRTRTSLENALGINSVSHLHWFYLAIDKTVVLHNAHRVSYFLSGPELRRDEIPFLHEVVECLCLAPHGSVNGYYRELNKITPIFHDGIEKQLADWGRGQVFEAINDYLKQIPIEQGQFPDVGNLAGIVKDLLIEFCNNPSAEDARIWGTIPFQQDHATEKTLPLAPAACINLANLKNALLFGSVQRACMGEFIGVWGAGSWAARDKPLYLLAIAAWIGYFRIHWRKALDSLFRRFNFTHS